MAFPTMNANVNSAVLLGKPLGTASTTISVSMELATGTFAYNLFEVPAVVDVSGMEFGVSILFASGTVVVPNTTIASGASTVELVFSDIGPTGTLSAVTLSNADDFSNTPTGGWTSNLMQVGVGNTTAADLDADDVVGLRVIANLTTAGGVGGLQLTTAYIYGKPGVIN